MNFIKKIIRQQNVYHNQNRIKNISIFKNTTLYDRVTVRGLSKYHNTAIRLFFHKHSLRLIWLSKLLVHPFYFYTKSFSLSVDTFTPWARAENYKQKNIYFFYFLPGKEPDRNLLHSLLLVSSLKTRYRKETLLLSIKKGI